VWTSLKLPFKALSWVWTALKAIGSFAKWSWNEFNDWCATIAPGVKTKTVTALGALGSGAYALQQYVSGLPPTTFVTAEKLSIITAVLFTLAFWFRGLGERTE